jgi:hypothetical protein
MTSMKKMRRSKRLLKRDRGSALLVSLMVIVGLSLLGLGFVAISETESAIARNQQNALQTQAVAEAGAKLVVEWFQDPGWGQTTGGQPRNTSANANLAAIKVTRVSGDYSGVYKPSATLLLFDKPYRPDPMHRFYADENTGDIVINQTTDATTITNVNKILFGPTAEDTRSGEITEIRIYAPPSVGGTLTQNGAATNPDGTPQMFWGGPLQRFGVATIKVTAAQFRDPNGSKTAASNIISQHAVRLVVGELPLPIPAGPIQGNANVSFGGSFQVHWGLETSTKDLKTSSRWTALPWANAFERPHFEHGYEAGTAVDSVSIMSGGSGYTSVPNITFSGGGAAAATATVTNGIITAVAMTAYGTGYNPQNPPNITVTGGGAGAGASLQANVGREVWPYTAGAFDNADFFHENLGKDFQDPWYGARAIGDNDTDGSTNPVDNPMCYPYQISFDELSTDNPSWAFQWQSVNSYPFQKRFVFPSILYDYWKRIAKQGRGYKGIYYFAYDAATGGFKRWGTGTAQPMSFWANSTPAGPGLTGSGLGAGFFFFDTIHGVNPQKIADPVLKTAELTPAEAWKTSDFGPAFLMQGFVYMNTVAFGTQGAGKSPTIVDANYPGEPFRDIGYPDWNTATSAWNQCPPNSGIPCRKEAGDGVFSHQELNNNGVCDIVVMQAPAWTSNDNSVMIAHASPFTMSNGNVTYVEKTWKSPLVATADYGAPCTVPAKTYDGTNPAPTDCSEPHEPYLNLIYPAAALNNSNKLNVVTVGWEAPKKQTYQAKAKGITCSATPSPADCTTNGYDLDGARVDLNVILYGVLYNEGQYNAEGNASYYGSVLIQDNITKGTGTADVWFDEKLIKGSWAPANMPRVIVFNEQTDEESQ